MKKFIHSLCLAGVAQLAAQEEPPPPFVPTLEITPVWEHLISKGGGPLPILKGEPLASFDNDVFDGTSEADAYGGFRLYDSNRALLGVRENGINESDPAHDAVLASAYPDRSLIWIDLTTGAPMGVALDVGFEPVPLDADFLAAGGTVLDFYFNFGVSEDGVVFVGYKNKILRYAPDGQGGFGSPTVAFTKGNDGSERWYQWRWENIRVMGAGSDTVLLAGGKTWRPNMGYYRLETTDGSTFSENGYVQNGFGNASGGASSIIPGRSLDYPDDLWVYVSSYPGSDNGLGTRFYRFVMAPLNDGLDVFSDPEYPGVQIPAALLPETDYHARFLSDVDAHPELDYVAAYSTPSWNSVTIGVDPPRPGYLALHDHSGELLATYTLDVTEADELIPDSTGAASVFHGTLGGLQLLNTPSGPRILWYSGIYGYGLFSVGAPVAGAGWDFDGSDPLPLMGGWPSQPSDLPVFVEDSPSGNPGDLSMELTGSNGAYYPDADGMLNFDDVDYSLQAWVKFETFASPSKIIIAAYGLPGGYSFWVTTERKVGATTYGILDFFSEAVVPDDGGWHHIALVHQQGVEMRFYVDGVLGDTIAYDRGVNPTADQNLYIGYERVSAGQINPFIGHIDRVKVTGKALAPSEFDYQAPPTGPSLSAERTANGLSISWEYVEGDTLQSKASLSDADWIDVPESASIEAGQATVVLPTDTGARFFRTSRQ